jgi:hypothetical protein
MTQECASSKNDNVYKFMTAENNMQQERYFLLETAKHLAL